MHFLILKGKLKKLCFYYIQLCTATNIFQDQKMARGSRCKINYSFIKMKLALQLEFP